MLTPDRAGQSRARDPSPGTSPIPAHLSLVAMDPNPDEPDDKPLAEIMRGIDAKEEPEDQRPRLAQPVGAGAPRGIKRKVGLSGYRGVAFHQVSGKWRARITSQAGDGRQRALGYYNDRETAARAWDAAARELGFKEEFLNFPHEGGEPAGAGPAQARAIGAHEGSSALLLAAAGAAENVARPFAVAPPSAGAIAAPRGNARRGTGVKGVRAKGNGTYEARIKLRNDAVRKCLGRFKSVQEAQRAYDNAARQAGYCVNQCARVGDLLDSDTFNALGEYTTAKGVKAVNKATATTLLSAPPPTPIVASGKRDGAGAEPSASAPASNALVAVPDAASETAHATSHGGLSAAATAAVPEGRELYAAFLLDKPGIHRFLGVFEEASAASGAIKRTVPEWKRKNEEREVKNGSGSAKKMRLAAAETRDGARARAGVGAGAGEELLLRPRGSVAEDLSAPPGANAPQGAGIHASLAEEVAGA